MAQRRMIHASIWESVQFTQLTDKARLLYIGLITHADDDGRFKADPKLIKAKVFPFDKIGSKRIAKLLESIQNVKLIELYEINNECFGFHPNWGKYQTLRQDRLKQSNIPHPLTTKCQPSDNQMSAQDKIREDNISKDNIIKEEKSTIKLNNPESINQIINTTYMGRELMEKGLRGQKI